MSTVTINAVPTGLSNIRHCQRCHIPYDWRRSTTTSLKMTYCTALCERADLGFTLDALMFAAGLPNTNVSVAMPKE